MFRADGQPAVAIIGAGRVGNTLAIALQRVGYPVVACASRSISSAHRLAERLPNCAVAATPSEAARPAQVVFLTVPDDAIETVAAEVAWAASHVAMHCSGGRPASILAPAAAAGARIAGFHPLQTFADPELGAESFPGSVVGIEADDVTWPLLVEMAHALGASPLRVSEANRPLYHAASVLVSNGTVGLMAVGAELWRALGVERADAVRALLPLLQGTVRNIESLGLPAALTGPVSRGDAGTVRGHVEALSSSPQLLALYRSLSSCLIELATERGTITASQVAALRAALEEMGGRARPH